MTDRKLVATLGRYRIEQSSDQSFTVVVTGALKQMHHVRHTGAQFVNSTDSLLLQKYHPHLYLWADQALRNLQRSKDHTHEHAA